MRVPQHLQRYLAETFSIDLRTLALFRAGLGILLLATLSSRFCDLAAFQSDSGVLPRAALLDPATPATWSLHFAGGSALFQGVLLALQALAALCLAAGYRTRLAAAVSWLLLASLHGRNPLVLTAGDAVLVALLFWAQFLPLAARWSVDAALSTTAPPDAPARSWASAGLLVQALGMHAFAALANPPGTYLQAPGMERLLSAAGAALLGAFPEAAATATQAAWAIALAAPLLALSPVLQKPLRLAAFVLLASLHFGLATCLALGPLPYAGLVAATILLGSGTWGWLGRRGDNGHHLKIYYDEACSFCLKACLLLRHLLVLPRTEILAAQGSSRAAALMEAQNSWVVIDGEDVAHTRWGAFVALLRHSRLFFWAAPVAALRVWEWPGNAAYDWVARHRGAFSRATTRLLPQRDERFEAPSWTRVPAALVLLAVLAANLSLAGALPAGVYGPLDRSLDPLRLSPPMDPLAPRPERGGWFVAPGQLADGSEVDVLRPRSAGVDYARPGNIAAAGGGLRWRAYRTRLETARSGADAASYSRWLCRQWQAQDRELRRFRMILMLEQPRPDGSRAPAEQRVLWQHDCAVSP